MEVVEGAVKIRLRATATTIPSCSTRPAQTRATRQTRDAIHKRTMIPFDSRAAGRLNALHHARKNPVGGGLRH